MHKEAGAQAVRFTTSRGYYESLTIGIVWRTPQTTSKVVYLSASVPAPMSYVHGVGHVAIFCTCADDLILRFRELFQGHSRFAAWFLSYLGWVYMKILR